MPVPEAEPGELREYCTQGVSSPVQSREREEQYKSGQFIIYLPKSNNQADEGVSLKLAQYLEPVGKAPVSEACKHLYSVYPNSKVNSRQAWKDAWSHSTLPILIP